MYVVRVRASTRTLDGRHQQVSRGQDLTSQLRVVRGEEEGQYRLVTEHGSVVLENIRLNRGFVQQLRGTSPEVVQIEAFPLSEDEFGMMIYLEDS